MFSGAIGEVAISADIGATVGAGGTVLDEELAEAMACGDSLSATRAMIALFTEAAMLACIAAAPGSAPGESISEAVDMAVTYVPSGFWAVVPPSADGWMVLAADQESWITVPAGGDFWIRQ